MQVISLLFRRNKGRNNVRSEGDLTWIETEKSVCRAECDRDPLTSNVARLYRTAAFISAKGLEAFPTRSPNDRLVPTTGESRPNKSGLIESLLSETALNTREINPDDPCAARDH